MMKLPIGPATAISKSPDNYSLYLFSENKNKKQKQQGCVVVVVVAVDVTLMAVGKILK